jgi:dynamin-binding protein
LVVVDKQLLALCIDLKALVEKQLLPQLRVLLATIKRLGLLFETLHALEPHHYFLLQHNPAKGRPPPALSEASVAFVALRAQLVTELPAYLGLLQDGVTLCVSQVIKWQSRLWRDVRTRWSDLWDALRVEGEMNAGNEETERVWRARWEEATRDLYNLNIIHPDKLTPRSRQTRTSPPSPTTTRTGPVNANPGSLEPARPPQIDAPSFVDSTASPHRKRSFNTSSSVARLARRPSTDSLHSIRSAKSSSGHGHYVDAPEFTPSPPRHTMSRRQSMPMSLHHSQSHGKLLDSYGREGRDRDKELEEEPGARGGGKHTSPPLPSLQRRNLGSKRARPSEPQRHPSPHPPHRQYTHPHPHPPMPPMPPLTVSSRWYRAPALYTCRVVHECEPPEGVEYYGLPFFKLFLGDVYHVLKEAGHPSRHRDLPLLVDEGEDCLLLARDASSELGWLLASFLFPVD